MVLVQEIRPVYFLDSTPVSNTNSHDSIIRQSKVMIGIAVTWQFWEITTDSSISLDESALIIDLLIQFRLDSNKPRLMTAQIHQTLIRTSIPAQYVIESFYF